MEEKEIKVSLEDVRKVLEKYKSAILNQPTIDDIMTTFQMRHLRSLPSEKT